MDPNKSVERKLAEFDVLERSSAHANLAYYATWGIVYVVTLLTGFLGATYLLFFYLFNFLGVEFSLVKWILNLFSA